MIAMPIFTNFRSVCTFLLVAAVLLLAPAAAQAQTAGTDREGQIRQLLEERDREIKGILGEKDSFTDAQRRELKTLINGLIDFRAMGRTALGPHWSDLNREQRAKFVDVFGQVVKEQSLSDLAPYRAPVSYQEITVGDDSAYVKTTSRQQGERIPVEYDLVYRPDAGTNGDGAWRARDIVVDEVSTVGGYKRSFRSIIRRHGYKALMKSLRNKLKEVRGSGS
jgi:phospholipid transport system substrate-binding protein